MPDYDNEDSSNMAIVDPQDLVRRMFLVDE